MPSTYRFHDFELKPEELSLYHNNQRLNLGLKGFKLLTTLIQNQGKVVPKNELIAAAWQGQIVTSGTLNKQIEFLRQLFSAIETKIKFIETKRGIGYQFIPKVKVIRSHRNKLRKWQKTIASVSVIPLVVSLYFYPFSKEILTNNIQNNRPLNIAIIPSAQGMGNEKIGSLAFLSTLLGKNPLISSLSPKQEWFSTENKNKLAIEIESQKDLDYVLLVDIIETNTGKIAAVELKNNNRFSAKKTVNALSYKLLFSDINTWVRNQLKIKNPDSSSRYNQNLSDDSFALESFLRGLNEGNSRNYSQAIQYYQMAITQDPNFTLARLKKAEAQIYSSDYHSAQASISTMESYHALNDELKLFLMALKSHVLIYTEKSAEASDLLTETIHLATSMQDHKILENVLYLQSVMFSQLGQNSDSINSTLAQQKLIQATTNDADKHARIANNLAYGYYANNQLVKAQEQIKSAIISFEKSNNTIGKFNSYDIFAHILYDLAKFNQEKSIVDQAHSLLPLIENKRLVLFFLETKAYLQIELGHHTQAKSTIDEIIQLSLTLKTQESEIVALGSQFELHLRKKDTQKIKLIYKQLDEKAQQLKATTPRVSTQIIFKLIAADFLLNQLDSAAKKITALSNLITDDQTNFKLIIELLKTQLMYVNGPKEQAQEQMQRHLQQAINRQQYRIAIEIAYLIVDNASLENDYKSMQSTLNKIAFIQPLSYPYLKYKAKIAAHKLNYFEASELMQKMKNSSNQWWNSNDQLLMNFYLEKINNKN